TALASLEIALTALLGMDQQLGRKRPPAQCSTDAEKDLESAALDQQLDALHARRDQQRGEITAWQIALAMTFTPLRFRGSAIPDVAPPVVGVDSAEHVDVRVRAKEELARTLTVLHTTGQLGVDFARPEMLHDQGRLLGARMRLNELAHRPMDLA